MKANVEELRNRECNEAEGEVYTKKSGTVCGNLIERKAYVEEY